MYVLFHCHKAKIAQQDLYGNTSTIFAAGKNSIIRNKKYVLLLRTVHRSKFFVVGEYSCSGGLRSRGAHLVFTSRVCTAGLKREIWCSAVVPANQCVTAVLYVRTCSSSSHHHRTSTQRTPKSPVSIRHHSSHHQFTCRDQSKSSSALSHLKL